MRRFDISEVNAGDDLRLDQPPIPYTPRRREPLPHKYDATDPLGLWQFDYVRAAGVRPADSFLDIGAGGGRLGQHLVSYLDPGRYIAVDVSRQALDWGWQRLTGEQQARAPRFYWGGDLSFEAVGPVDFAFAHSVLTHLTWNQIGRCLHELRTVTRGAFHATYFRCETPWRPQPYGPKPSPKRVSHGHRDPFHYRFETIRRLAEETGWTAEHADLPAHPKGQSMLCFSPR